MSGGAGLALLVACLIPTGSEALAAQDTGAVRGRVELRLDPPRRSASRYPGTAAAVHAVQEIPAVVYVEGRVADAPARPAAAAVMTQQDTAFMPAALVVDVGSTVRFPNGDSFFHNVFSYSTAARFDLGRYPRGEAKEVTFDKPGIVKIYCEVHDFMRAVVVVAENPFHTVVDRDGGFRIEGIPEGEYTLVFWHPDVEPVRRRITVRAGATVVADAELR